jgi:hypothetical protein
MVLPLAAILEHPVLSFKREPALEHRLTVVDVAPLPNLQRDRIYVFRRTVRHIDDSEVSWADTKSCPAATWVVEEAIKVPPPRIEIPGVKDPTAPDQITLTMDGVGYSLSGRARYGSRLSSTINFTSNMGTPLASWVEESLRRLEHCWSKNPPSIR